jgi:Tfp pilus assembly protein PilN
VPQSEACTTIRQPAKTVNINEISLSRRMRKEMHIKNATVKKKMPAKSSKSKLWQAPLPSL